MNEMAIFNAENQLYQGGQQVFNLRSRVDPSLVSAQRPGPEAKTDVMPKLVMVMTHTDTYLDSPHVTP
jgi:hypothetical protein